MCALFGRALVVFLFLTIIFGCAPKKVRIYESTSDVRNNIIQTSASFMGKPYKSGAKGPDAFDCSGFVYYVFGQSRVALPVTAEGILKMGYQGSRGSRSP